MCLLSTIRQVGWFGLASRVEQQGIRRSGEGSSSKREETTQTKQAEPRRDLKEEGEAAQAASAARTESSLKRRLCCSLKMPRVETQGKYATAKATTPLRAVVSDPLLKLVFDFQDSPRGSAWQEERTGGATAVVASSASESFSAVEGSEFGKTKLNSHSPRRDAPVLTGPPLVRAAFEEAGLWRKPTNAASVEASAALPVSQIPSARALEKTRFW